MFIFLLLAFLQIGNGDVLCVEDARQMWLQTGCDGLMIGRGALQDPLLFLRIRAAWAALQPQQQHSAPDPAAASRSTMGQQQQQQQWDGGQHHPQHVPAERQLQGQGQSLHEKCFASSSSSNSSGSSSTSSSSNSSSSSWAFDESAMVQQFLRVYAAMGFEGKTSSSQALVRAGEGGRKAEEVGGGG